MKIQWFQSNIRIRIKPAELEALQRAESVSEILRVPGSGHWSAELLPGSMRTGLTVVGSLLRISLTAADVNQLSKPDLEGVYFKQEGVTYYVEKDFPCAHSGAGPAAESATGKFPPNESFKKRKNIP